MRSILFVAVLFLGSCGTYYDPADDYARGLRFFDRGDFTTAAQLWEPISKQGDCDAEARYAYLRFTGAGIEKDQRDGTALMSQAAAEGQPFAAITLALLYADGALPSPRQMAARIADQTSPAVACTSCGIDRDPVRAYLWFRLAQRFAVYDNQREAAEDGAVRVSTLMTDEQRRIAEAQLSSWKASEHSCRPRRLL